MKAVTPVEIKNMDLKAAKNFGLREDLLMENAGAALADAVRKEVGGSIKDANIVFLCGRGNNGGDGFVAARVLLEKGYTVKVLCCFKEGESKGLSLKQLKKLKPVVVEFLPSAFEEIIRESSVIVDALLGIGAQGEIEDPHKTWIRIVNRCSIPVISVDIPSGLDSLRGIPLGECVKAKLTLTMGLPKIGLLYENVTTYTGKLCVANIGYPEEILEDTDSRIEVLAEEEAKEFVPGRVNPSHKRTYGHLFIVTGSPGFTGAGIMCGRAAMRTGVGLVTLGIPESLVSNYQPRLIEEMPVALTETDPGLLGFKALPQILNWAHKTDTIVIGPGLSRASETMALVRDVVKYNAGTMLLDADGITALSENTDILNYTKGDTVITPHAGEMARLLHCSTEDVQEQRWALALEFAQAKKTNVVLKGARTVIAGRDGRFSVNITGNPGMATGGSGDVLSGIIGALIAQGLGCYNASVFGTYIHGLAGDIAAEEKGEISLIASDIINALPLAFKKLLP